MDATSPQLSCTLCTAAAVLYMKHFLLTLQGGLYTTVQNSVCHRSPLQTVYRTLFLYVHSIVQQQRSVQLSWHRNGGRVTKTAPKVKSTYFVFRCCC